MFYTLTPLVVVIFSETDKYSLTMCCLKTSLLLIKLALKMLLVISRFSVTFAGVQFLLCKEDIKGQSSVCISVYVSVV